MRSFMIMFVALFALGTPALAQDTQQQTSSGANANGTVNAYVLGSAGNPRHSTIYTTPGVQGSFFSGANPCLIGTGGGAAGGPVGLSLNFGKNDEGCTRRSDAAAWHALGYDAIAVSRMCQDTKNADAFYASTGLVCPGADRKRYKKEDGTLPEFAVIDDHPADNRHLYSPQPVPTAAPGSSVYSGQMQK